jgi:membrane fusion protein, heavy metal efflux system
VQISLAGTMTNATTRLTLGLYAAFCWWFAATGCGDKGNAERDGADKGYEKGPHGGRLLGDRGFQTEVTIYERGVPPQFRVYAYADGKPLPPVEVELRIDLHRHGGRLDQITFKPEGTYLLGDKTIEEPHSFDVEVRAAHRKVSHTWKYSSYEGRVELTDEAVRTSEIKVETAGPVKMKSALELPGEIKLNADKVAHVVPRLSGVLRSIRKNQGDDVKKGEVIAVLDSKELAELRRSLNETTQLVTFAKRAYEREEALWKKGISSEASYLQTQREYEEAKLKNQSARQQLAALGAGTANSTLFELRAPFDGVIIEKNVATGQAVKDDEDLFTIADLSTVWVEVNVYAKDLNAVKVGQDVTVKAESLDLTAPGKIVYLGSLVGEHTRSATARVVLPDAERRWRAGLFVSVEVVQEEYTAPVVVKREGLQKFRDWDVVFVRAGTTFEARPLELGRTDGEWIEVRSGLSAGEKYASANSFILKADVGKAGASHDH